MRHTGHEYGFLLSGRLTVHLGFDTFVLEAGSSINFDSATPHAYVNESSEAAQGIWHVVEQNTADATSQTFAQRRYSAAEENGDVHERVDAADTTGVKY